MHWHYSLVLNLPLNLSINLSPIWTNLSPPQIDSVFLPTTKWLWSVAQKVLMTDKTSYYKDTWGQKHDMSSWKKLMGTHNLNKAYFFQPPNSIAFWSTTNFHLYSQCPDFGLCSNSPLWKRRTPGKVTWFQFTGQNIQLLPENWDPFQNARDNARRTKESAYRGSYWLNCDDVFKHQKENKATVKWNQLSYWKTKSLLWFQERKVNIKGKWQLQRKAEYNRTWLVFNSWNYE